MVGCRNRTNLSLASLGASLLGCFVLVRVDFIKVDMITDFNWDQRLHGVTSRDKQSRHSEIFADRMQFITMKSEAVDMR